MYAILGFEYCIVAEYQPVVSTVLVELDGLDDEAVDQGS